MDNKNTDNIQVDKDSVEGTIKSFKDNAKKKGAQDALSVEIPSSGLLVLRDDGDPPECMRFEIRTPDGSVTYKAPVIRMSDYTLEDIFNKKMYFLIPFYFFNLEKQFDRYNADQEELETFAEIFCDIIQRVLSDELSSARTTV